MRVSFIVPCLDEELLLPSCLIAIQIAAFTYAKDHEDFEYEMIVVDNGSADQSALLAILHGARVITCKERGLTRARQAGMLAARHGTQAFIDADNRIPPAWLDNLSALTDDPQCVAISGPVWFDQQGPIAKAAGAAFTWAQRLAHRYIGVSLQGGNFVLKRSALLAVGGFPLEVDFFGEDTLTGLRLSRVGKVKFLPALWCNSSARRFNRGGYLKTAFLYSLNYFSIHFLGRPITLSHRDYRA